ncbi:hypothetical protein GCM10027610_083290 [Dactylosporangium cerinum]
MVADRRDFYEILGVPRTATAEEIQRAYRTLARRNHPDVNKEPGAEDRFKDVTEAYDVLSDPKSRRKYDRFGAQWRQVPDDVEQRAGARQRASAGAGYPGQGAGFGGRGDVGEEVDLEDLLGSIFGGRPSGGGDRFGRGPVPGADTEAEITISVEDAYHGGRRRITLPGGAGGRTREYEVTIPAGVTEGQRIRLAGQGSGGARGGPSGDLYLVVHIAPHPGTSSAVATSRWKSRWRRGRRPWAPRCRSRRPAAPCGSPSRQARRPGGGCGCVARGCRTRAAPPATSTPRSGSWCRRG